MGPHDVFPEELIAFLFPPGRLRELFLELHGELVDPGWWQARQAERRAGVETDFLLYPEETRFASRWRAHERRMATGSER